MTDQPQLTDEEIARVMARDNGDFAILELARMGRVSPERAVTAIKAADKTPWWKRLGWAIVEAVFDGNTRGRGGW